MIDARIQRLFDNAGQTIVAFQHCANLAVFAYRGAHGRSSAVSRHVVKMRSRARYRIALVRNKTLRTLNRLLNQGVDRPTYDEYVALLDALATAHKARPARKPPRRGGAAK